MKLHQTIFSVKELRNKINYSFVNGIRDRNNKIQIIEQWQEGINSGKVLISKEEELKSLFLNLFFGDILGYNYKNARSWNLRLENKTDYDNSKADAALGFFSIEKDLSINQSTSGLKSDVRAVIEIKDAGTTLDKPQNRADFKGSPVEQGFNYAAKSGENCKWVIVSNFLEIRLYLANDMTKYERFDIRTLHQDFEFSRFYYLLAFGQLFFENTESTIENLLKNRQEKEKTITKSFYEHYRYLREIFVQHLKLHNPSINILDLIKYAQTIIDRVIFVSVIKDYDLIQSSVLKEIEDISAKSWADDKQELWRQLNNLFKALDKGLHPRIHKFNGGLFRHNENIEKLLIKDVLLKKILELGRYDFESDLNVNILGHIFEQSITDIESLKKDISDNIKIEYSETDNEVTYKPIYSETNKRKKDGIYYTPETITRYIVTNTVGKWLADKKNEIGIDELSDFPINSNEQKRHIELWHKYEFVLKNIKILDPACGSGAFLTQTFDFLLHEWLIVLDVTEKLQIEHHTSENTKKVGLFVHEIDKTARKIAQIKKDIVNKNLFGVDLNSESVEITKLGLWLKSASKNDPLALLDSNIKCGNSLISDKSFDWNIDFKEIIQNGGFDVIIGNPPYVGQKGNKDVFSSLKTSQWADFYERKQDIYYYFYKLSVDLVTQDGLIGFITPQSWLTAYAASNLRKYLADKCSLIKVWDTSTQKIFTDASINSMIFILKKNINSDNIRIENGLPNTPEYSIYDSQVKNHELSRDNWNIFKTQDYVNISQNIDFIKLGEIANISPGVQTGCDKVTKNHIDTYKLDSSLLDKGIFIINENDFDFSKISEYEKSFLKPLFKNSDINRYFCNLKNKYLLINTNLIDDIQSVPSILKHLEKFKPIILNRYINFALKQAYTENKWWYLYGYRPNTDFEGRKIVFPYRATMPKFCFVNQSYYGSIDIFYITNLDTNYDYYYILAILNSKLMNYFIASNFKKKGAVIEFYTQPMSEIPIPKISIDNQKVIVDSTIKLIENSQKRVSNLEKLVSRLQKSYNLNIDIQVFQDFNSISFEELMSVFKRNNIKLALKQQDDLEDYLNEFYSQVSEQNNAINLLEIQIDTLIYRLFNISNSEIDIIEKYSNSKIR